MKINLQTNNASILEEVERQLPLICSVKTLIGIGLYPNRSAFHFAKVRGSCPEYFLISPRHIRFHKQIILDWLENKLVSTKEEVANG